MRRVFRSRCVRLLGVGLLAALPVGVGGGPAVSADEEGVLLGVFVVRGAAEPTQRDPAQLQDEFRSVAGDRVFFSEASVELGAKAKAVLAAQAEWLRRNPDFSLRIEGHSDEPGGPARNDALSLWRAQAVQAQLVEFGIAQDRLRAEALGNAFPVALCSESACAAQNRRAVSVVDLASTVPAGSTSRLNQLRYSSGPRWGEQAGTR